MNPELNVKAMKEFVCPETEDTFNDKFWNSLSFVVNAVDNIKARLYVDSKCVWYKKALLESGTLGTKANSQMIVPGVTQCYGDSTDPPEEGIPMCTLRNFPNQIEHCIEWGRAEFNSLFVDRASETVDYLTNPKVFMGQLKSNNTTAGEIVELEKIKHMIELKSNKSFEGCVLFARQYFEEKFWNQIAQLVHIFPKEYKTQEGQLFWSGPKRFPSMIKFDAGNDLHLHFLAAASNLLAFNLGIPQNRDLEQIREIVSKIHIETFVPKSGVKIQTEEKKDGEEEKVEDEADEDDFKILDQLRIDLDVTKLSVKPADFYPIDFEKDDDKNFHIDFIHATAQMRAENYQIPTCDQQNTKMIAGKIIPAIATTTAMVVGVVGIELYKIVQGFDKIEDYRNGFFNLAIPLFVFTEPSEAIQNKDVEYDPIMCGPIKSVPTNWTIWDLIDINKGSMTIQELFDYLKVEYKVEISLLAVGTLSLYNSYLPGDKQKSRLPRKIEDVYEEVARKANVFVEGKCDIGLDLGANLIECKSDVTMPKIKYVFK